VEQALASRAKPVIVVTGHERERVEAALKGLPVQFVHNPDFAVGLGGSVRTGIAAVPAAADGAIVCLGDMPQVDCRADRPADRGFRARARRARGGADDRRPTRQSGVVVAAASFRT